MKQFFIALVSLLPMVACGQERDIRHNHDNEPAQLQDGPQDDEKVSHKFRGVIFQIPKNLAYGDLEVRDRTHDSKEVRWFTARHKKPSYASRIDMVLYEEACESAFSAITKAQDEVLKTDSLATKIQEVKGAHLSGYAFDFMSLNAPGKERLVILGEKSHCVAIKLWTEETFVNFSLIDPDQNRKGSGLAGVILAEMIRSLDFKIH